MRAVEGTGEQMRIVDGMAVFFYKIGGNHGQDSDWTQGAQVSYEKSQPLMRGTAQERLAGPGRTRSHLGYARVEVVWPPSLLFPCCTGAFGLWPAFWNRLRRLQRRWRWS